MTTQKLRQLIKKAKEDFNVGAPTTTGVASGLGLGAILATLGSLSNANKSDKEKTLLTNPLILGTLGAAGGYLAGNALEKMPATREKELSDLSLLGILGGIGGVGSLIADDDAREIFRARSTRYRNIQHDSLGNPIKFDSLSDSEKQIWLKAEERYQRALKRLGRYKESDSIDFIRKRPPSSLTKKIIERLRYSSYSPVNIAKALNPFKNIGVRGATSGITRLGSQLRLVGSTTKGRIAALALLAGLGKGVYDYTRD